MELKQFLIATVNSCGRCFNRTFMELKHENLCIGQDFGLGFNRTFMELKRDHSDTHGEAVLF